jgi:group I intron endonuclease
MKMGIYKITNTRNGKFYIGSSKDINRRWWEHKNDLNKKTHINAKLQNAWNFYGENQFKFEIVEEIMDDKLLLEREQHYLNMFEPYRNGIGYNIAQNSCGGDNFTHNPNKENIRQQLSELYSGENNPMFGKKHNDESLLKQKQKAIGRFSLNWFIEKYGNDLGSRMYEERRLKLSSRTINYKYDNKITGKKRGAMSDEMKLRISEKKRKFALRKNEFVDDLKSGRFTILQLSEKYDVSMTTIKSYKKKF